jgi:hypothetical protein
MERHMKNKNLKHTLTAALLTLVATAAYGQTGALTANIPFAFRAVGSDLPAGRYRVARAAGTDWATELRNLDTGKAVVIMAKAPIKDSADARPRLIFRCGGEEGCSLISLRSGTGSGFEFSTPALTASQRERRETIYLDRYKGK